MPAFVREFEGYRIAIYSPSSHFAVITGPGSNRVLDLQEKQPRSTAVEGPLVCLDRAESLAHRRRATKGHQLPVGHAAA